MFTCLYYNKFCRKARKTYGNEKIIIDNTKLCDIMKIQRTYGNVRRKEQLEMINVMELKAQLKRTGMTQANLAEKVGMNPATLNRKINNVEGETLTVKEATEIAKNLDIPKEKLTFIFFAN